MGKISVLMALIMVLCLGGCGEKQEAEDLKPIVKIGGILPLTGGVTQMGEGARNGALMAIEVLNADAEKKYKYEFVYEDIGLNPSKTVHVFEPILTLFPKQLLQDGYKGKLSSFLMFAYSDNPSIFNEQPFVDMKNATDEFNQKYKDKFGIEPMAASVNTYDNIMLIANFLEKNGVPMEVSSEEVNSKIRDVIAEYKGPRGCLQMDDNGLIFSETVIKMVQDGKPVEAVE